MKKYSFFLLSTLFLLCACEKEIPLKQNEAESRIVVNSKFLNGDTCRVHLSQSRQLDHAAFELPVINNAVMQLLDENNIAVGNFVYEQDGTYAMYDFIPSLGNTYTFEASVEGFETVTASSSIPSVIQIDQLDTATIINQNQMKFNLSFSDNPSEDNFYSIKIFRRTIIVEDGVETWGFKSPYFSTNEFFVVNGTKELTGEKRGEEFFFTDESFDGQSVNFEAFLGHDKKPENHSITIHIQLNSMSEALYKYKLTHSNYMQANQNPFAEPVQIYSNIENGFGIFGGYSTFRDSIFIQ